MQPASATVIEPSVERARDSNRETRETGEDGNLLKRYKILGLIGLGNYARVYKAIFVRNNKDLAIKAINLAKTTDNYRHKFLPRELAILRRVNHDNICKVFEIVQVADRIYIVMQFCSRGTIADLLQRNSGPFHEPVARFLFGPTVAAVAYLHQNDIAHRDVKIENILLDQNYNPKLTDFSYSCRVRSAESSCKELRSREGGRPKIKLNETFCGTLPYLSPEMIKKKAYDAKKTDSWSLGICLYVLLNDRLPFPFSDIRTMVRRQLTRDYEFRHHIEVGEGTRELVAQMLEPDPAKRLMANDAGRHTWFNGPRERPPDDRAPK